MEASLPPAQRKSWYDARADIGGDTPESCHEMEMVGRVTVSPAAGDVNWTSAKTEGTSVANSQANLRIMVVVLLGVRVGQTVLGDQCCCSQEGRTSSMDTMVCLDNSMRTRRRSKRRRSRSRSRV